jgi:large subunit ribosomal protein L9
MQVILMHDVENVGHEGDLVKVSDGYARNLLLPRKLAVKATPGAVKDLEQRKRAIERRQVEKRDAASVLADRLQQQPLVLHAHVGEGGRLHGQITPQMIVDAVKAQLNMEVSRRDVEIAEPIRLTGDYIVRVAVYKGVHAQLPVTVISEGGEAEAMVEPKVEAKVEAEVEAEADADVDVEAEASALE